MVVYLVEVVEECMIVLTMVQSRQNLTKPLLVESLEHLKLVEAQIHQG